MDEEKRDMHRYLSVWVWVCVWARLSPPGAIVHQAVLSTADACSCSEKVKPPSHVSCHSRWSWLQTQHSPRPCRGASCRGVWSEIRDGFNCGEFRGQWASVSTRVFESEPRCSHSSLNKCGLIPISSYFPNGLFLHQCLRNLSTRCKLKGLIFIRMPLFVIRYIHSYVCSITHQLWYDQIIPFNKRSTGLSIYFKKQLNLKQNSD